MVQVYLVQLTTTDNKMVCYKIIIIFNFQRKINLIYEKQKLDSTVMEPADVLLFPQLIELGCVCVGGGY